MSKLLDLAGHKSGRLTALYRVANSKSGNARWHCQCECGGSATAIATSLKSGRTKSCGCLMRENAAKTGRKNGAMNCRATFTTHGASRSPTYRSWQHMKDRCGNENNENYKWYGARGIAVCDRWLESFENFLEDMGERPPGTSIDRIDFNGNYEPNNCRWATRLIQQKNKRPISVSGNMVTAFGETKTIKNWWRDDRCVVKETTLGKRFRSGWSPEKAITTPAGGARWQTHCIRGHKLAGDNVYVAKTGKRQCLVCRRLRRRVQKSRAPNNPDNPIPYVRSSDGRGRSG